MVNDISLSKARALFPGEASQLNEIVAHQHQMALFVLYHTLSQCCPEIDPAGIFPDQATGSDHGGRYVNWERPVHKKTWNT